MRGNKAALRQRGHSLVMLEDELIRSFYLLLPKPSLIDLGERVKFFTDRLADSRLSHFLVTPIEDQFLALELG